MHCLYAAGTTERDSWNLWMQSYHGCVPYRGHHGTSYTAAPLCQQEQDTKGSHLIKLIWLLKPLLRLRAGI